MMAEFTLPRLGETMESGRVAAWLKQPGERFERGETIVEIESDKTTVEMPALADGVLREILIEAGRDVEVGAVLCRYDDGRDGGGDAEAAATPPGDPTATEPDNAHTPAAGAQATEAPPPSGSDAPANESAAPAAPVEETPADAGRNGRRRATPLARRMARQSDLELAALTGSGPRGRIEATDVRAALDGRGEQPQATGAAEPAAIRSAPPSGSVARRDWAAAHATGTPILLLHGLAADAESWSSLAGALVRAGRRVSAIDLPGHGATAIEADDLDAVVSVAASFLRDYGDEPVELVGHSIGGAVAARVARRMPSRVRRLTLIAPAGLDRAIDIDFVRSIARVRSGGALAHLQRRLAVRPPAIGAQQLDALAAGLARGRLVALADAVVDDGGQQIDITGDLRALPMPVRIVWGTEDRIIPWTEAKEAGSRCAVHLIPHAGHVPHWDQPAEVAALFD